MKRLSLRPAWAVLAVLVLVLQSAHAQLHPVALSGQPAPGTGDAATFSTDYWYSPIIGNAGLTFRTSLAGPRLFDETIWVTDGDADPILVARKEAAPAPGAAAAVFSNFETPHINNLGQTAFRATLSIFSPGVTMANRQGIWRGRAGELQLAVRTAQQAPGTPDGVVFSGFSDPFISDLGHVTFKADLDGLDVNFDNSRGIWTETAAGLVKIVRLMDPAPGIPGALIKSYSDPVAANASVAFKATLSAPDITADNDEVIYAGNAQSPNLIAREDDPAPGAGGKRFWWMNEPVVNNHGQTAFLSRLTDFGVGIWSTGHGPLAPVALRDTSAPGGGDFDGFENPMINDEGDVVFAATLSILSPGVDGESNGGIWKQTPTGMQLVARRGAHAPGLPPDRTFVFFHEHQMNNLGQVAFRGGTDAVNDGIWAQDRNGNLQLLVYRGQSLEVLPGDFRTVDHLTFADPGFNPDQRARAFNDLGQVLFRTTFTDGSAGVFLVTVPEPASLLGLCAVVLLIHRRRPQKGM